MNNSIFLGIIAVMVSAEFAIAPRLLAQEADVKKLNQARVEAAKRAHDLSMRSLRAGNGGKPEEIHTWSVRWLKAQHDRDGKEADRLVAWKDHFQRMKDLEKHVEALVKAGIGSATDSAAAQFYA